MMTIGITGASGFVGRALCAHLASQGHTVRRLLRRAGGNAAPDDRIVGDIGPDTDWRGALDGLACMVHCAAHVHRMQPGGADDLAAYRRVNTQGTLRLARAAAQAGVRRFVFISSVKVLGEATPPGQPFRHDSPPGPQDPYGQSKWEAEQALWPLARETGLEVVVIRPPLVYGPGVGANFHRLMRWVASGLPIPLKSVRNRRSLVSVGNLVDLIALCTRHPGAAGQTLLVSDGHDLSTPELIEGLGQAMGIRPRLWPTPVAGLMLAGRLAGRRAMVERLVQSLQVDIAHTREHLGWAPPLAVEQGLTQAVAGIAGAVAEPAP